jgi:hypothetical protein
MNYIKKIVILPGLKEEMWNESHEYKIKEFLKNNDKKILSFYLDNSSLTPNDDQNDNSNVSLVVKFEIPTNISEQFMYFVKSYYSQEINNKETFHKCI